MNPFYKSDQERRKEKKCVIYCYFQLKHIDFLCWQQCWAVVIMLQHVAVAETSHVSIFAVLLCCISGSFFVSPSRVRLMHCTLLFSVIQKKSLSLDPQGALMVSLLQNRWQQPFIKANACFCLLTTVQSSLRLMRCHAHIYHTCACTWVFQSYSISRAY